MKKISTILLAISGLLLAILPLMTDCAAFNKFMKDGSYTGNHLTAVIFTAIGVLVVILAILTFIIKKNGIGYITYVISLLCSIFGLLVIRSVIKLKSRFLLDMVGAKTAFCQNCHMGVMDGSHERFVFINTILMAILLLVSLFGIISLFLGKKNNG